jgi:hypothetical protein
VLVPERILNCGSRCCIKPPWDQHWWLTPVILATQEAEIRRIAVRSQPGQIVRETLSQKTLHQKRAGGEAQSIGREFKLQYIKKRTKKHWGR